MKTGQKTLVDLFDSGEVRAFRIKYPNGTVDIFRGWLSSLGKTITAKEVMTRTVKISGVGRPFLAEEDAPSVISVSGVTVAPLNASVAVGATTTLTFTLKPDDATDKSLRIASSDTTLATVTQKDNVATVKGVKAGSVTVVGITTDGSLVAVAPVTVTAP
ncbi:major tail protein [Salmonella sp. NCTC 11881]|nr:major tail protein [Salmonella sp. NCTC 11881]